MRNILVLTVLSASIAASVTFAQVLESTPGETPLTLGYFTGEEGVFGQGDLLFPLFRHNNNLLFLNPRVAISDRSEEEFNLGLGMRRLLELDSCPMILGANIYYDARWSRHNNRFDQIGVGLEMLSHWVDARANYYRPGRDTYLADSRVVETSAERRYTIRTSEMRDWDDPYATGYQIRQDYSMRTTTRNITETATLSQVFLSHETALEGFDAELGIRFPWLTEWFQTRVFGGYQYFDNPFGGHLQGWKGRLELRTLDGRLSFDAHLYENRELNLTDYLVGARLTIPFDLGDIARRENPLRNLFRGRPQTLGDRLTEMVMRDPKIQTRQSEFIEDPARREVEVKRRNNTSENNTSQTLVLADGVTFVDGDRGDDGNPGTFEQPKASVQGGVDAARETTVQTMESPWPDIPMQAVYVSSFDGAYNENVRVERPGLVIWGSGMPFPGYDGRTFGSGVRPLIHGNGSRAIDITAAADGTILAGLEITTGGSGEGVYSQSGIISLLGNHIHTTIDAIYMEQLGTQVDTYIYENLIANNDAYGFEITSNNGGDTFWLDLRDNVFEGNNTAARVSASNYQELDIDVAGNRFVGNQQGLWINAATAMDSEGNVSINVSDNLAEDIFSAHRPNGFEIYAESWHGSASITLQDNTARNLQGNAFVANADAQGNGNARLIATGNHAEDSDGGLFAILQSVGGQAGALFIGNTALNTGWSGFYTEAYSTAGNAVISMVDNQASGATTAGMDGVIHAHAIAGGSGNAVVMLLENEASGNAGLGINAWSRSTDGLAQVMADGNSASDNYAGMYLLAHGRQADVQARDSLTFNNTESGLYAEVQAIDLASVALIGNQAVNNRWGLGIYAQSTEDDVTIVVKENQSIGNTKNIDATGMFILGDALAGEIWLDGQDNVFRGNSEGLRIGLTGITLHPNFGRAGDSTMGHNSFDNIGANLTYVGTTPLSAENNWWGTTDPEQFGVVGPVDTDPWLTTDPNP